MIRYDNLEASLKDFKGNAPFDHCVIDNFFQDDVAQALSLDFPDYDSDDWYFYNNAIEHKKAQNSWEKFPLTTYKAFSELQSERVTDLLAEALGEKIYVDHGLNGGGWHMHGQGGNLNPHVDYSIHPKLHLERVLNIIVYLSSELKEEYGGHLGLWGHDTQKSAPGQLIKEVAPVFNRAILFNTTQNSWHGMSRKMSVPAGVYRKSLAIYYLRDPAPTVDQRGRALFAPREEQRGDQEVLETIRLRSSVATSSSVYRTKS